MTHLVTSQQTSERLAKLGVEQIKELADKICDMTGYGHALCPNDIIPDIRHSLASLLTAEIGVLEGRLGSWPCPHCGGSEAVIPEVIERYRDLIKSLE